MISFIQYSMKWRGLHLATLCLVTSASFVASAAEPKAQKKEPGSRSWRPIIESLDQMVENLKQIRCGLKAERKLFESEFETAYSNQDTANRLEKIKDEDDDPAAGAPPPPPDFTRARLKVNLHNLVEAEARVATDEMVNRARHASDPKLGASCSPADLKALYERAIDNGISYVDSALEDERNHLELLEKNLLAAATAEKQVSDLHDAVAAFKKQIEDGKWRMTAEETMAFFNSEEFQGRMTEILAKIDTIRASIAARRTARAEKDAARQAEIDAKLKEILATLGITLPAQP